MQGRVICLLKKILRELVGLGSDGILDHGTPKTTPEFPIKS